MRRWFPSLLLISFVLVVAVGGYYGLWYRSQRQEAIRRYHRAMNTLSEQIEGVTGNVLRVFATTARAGILNELLAIQDTRILTVRSRSIRAAPQQYQCTLAFDPGTDPTLRLSFTGWAVNARNNTETIVLELTSNFPALIEPYLGSAPFDAILLADEQGRIFERRGRVGAKGLNLDPKLIQAPTQSAEAGPRVARDQVIWLEGHEYLVFSRLITLDLGSLGGQSASGQALKGCAAESSKQTRTLRAVGLVKLETLREESQRIPQVPLVALLLVVLLLFFSLPFLKLFTLGPRERFQRWDLAFLVAGSLAMAALAVLVILIVSSWRSLAWQEEDQMKSVASDIRNNFTCERRMAYEQIKELEEELKEELAELTKLGSVQRLERAPYEAPPETVSPYPGFERAMLVADSGELVAFLTVREHLPPAPNVRERKYFKAIIEKEEEVAPGDFAPNAVTPIDSWATGKRITLFAKHGEYEKQYRLAALMARTLSLERTVLAPKYRLAVVDPDGKVLYHTDTWRAEYENLLEECDQPAALVKALKPKADSGQKALLYVSYAGKPHRMLVVPLVEPPVVGNEGFTAWRLVILHDREDIRTLHLRVLGYSLVGLLVPLALACIVVLLPQEWLQRRWFAPREDAQGRRRQIRTAVLALGALPALLLYGWFFTCQAVSLAREVNTWDTDIKKNRKARIEREYKQIEKKEIPIEDRLEKRLDEHDWSSASTAAWLVPAPARADWLGRTALSIVLFVVLGLTLLLPLELARRAAQRLGLLPQPQDASSRAGSLQGVPEQIWSGLASDEQWATFLRNRAGQDLKPSAEPARPGWQKLRTAVILLVVLLSGFLFFLQQETFLTVSAAVTSIGGLLAAIYQLGGQIRRRGSQEPAKEGTTVQKGETS